MSASGFVHLEVEKVVAETDKAFLFLIDGDEHWIPRSQVADPGDYSEGDENCTVSVTEWVARQRGLIE